MSVFSIFMATKVILFFILSFSFLTRLYDLGSISKYYFDEQYHVPAVKLILRGDVSAFEWWHDFSNADYPLTHDPHAINNSNFDWLHPPLAKYFQAFSMSIFGENAWGWRLPSAIFGVMVVGMVYLLAQKIFKDEKLSLLASFLVSMSGLLFVQSRIAMNDIFVTFWILGVVYFYWREKYFLTGVFLGLAVATKWSGLFIGIYLIFSELFYFIKNNLQKEMRQLPWRIFSLIFVPIFIYFLVYLPMFIMGKDLGYFFELHEKIFSYQFSRDANHAYQSRPWEWFFNLRSVWYWKGNLENKVANIYALENPVLALGGVVAILATLGKIFKQLLNKEKIKKTQETRLLDSQITRLLLIYSITFLPWMFSPRILFFYHYTPAIPFLSIIVAFWLRQLWQKKKILVISFLVLVGISFGVYYPHWTGLLVPKTFVEKVYFSLPNWK